MAWPPTTHQDVQDAITGLQTSSVASTGIRQIVALSQSAYDALATKDSATLYVITGAAYTPPATTPKVGTFTETFDALNTSLWTATPTVGNVTIVSGNVDLRPVVDANGTNYTTYTTVNTYDLTASATYVQATQMPAGGDSMEAEFFFGTGVGVNGTGGSNGIGFVYSGGSLYFRTWDAGAKRNLSNVVYNATTMKYWRIRHDGTTLNWDTSADASTWTTQANEAASAISYVPNSGKLILRAGFWNPAQTATADARFSSINVP